MDTLQGGCLRSPVGINRNYCNSLTSSPCLYEHVCSVSLCDNRCARGVYFSEVHDDGPRGLTIVCEDALRSNHLIADMADNKTKILQCGKMAVADHI